jgi:hypothetical protein
MAAQLPHDDGLYSANYAEYSNDEQRVAAETELLYSQLDEQASELKASEAAQKQVDDEDDDEDKEASTAGLSYQDPVFLAGGSSLYRNPFQPPRGAMPAEMIEWNRLSKLEVEGMTRCALFGCGVPGVEEEPTAMVVQGALKNCWLIGACAVLATKPELCKALFVSDQDNFGVKGLYTLRFFKCGLPRFVHVDDRVPCNRAGRVHYSHTHEPNETWLQLVEKAYAKLHGCYENLTYGGVDRGLRDLTGWPSFKHALDPALDGKLWGTLRGYMDQPRWLMALENAEDEGTPGDGVLAKHAYAILEMQEVRAEATAQFDALDVRMVKLHNPWGMSDWTGDWCRSSDMWSKYPEIAKQLSGGGGGDGAADDKKKKKKTKGKGRSEYDLAAEAATEAAAAAKDAACLWMAWEDVLDHFTVATAVADVLPQASKDGAPKAKDAGAHHRFRGRWVPGDPKTGAGGCPEHVSWPQNPQYAFEVPEHGTQVVVTLSTADVRFQSLDTAAGEAGNGAISCIGFVVMALTGAKMRSTKFHPLKMRAQSPGFSRTPSVSAVMVLRAGRYAVVPSTFDPEADATNFVLEVNASRALAIQGGDELPDADDLDESDDEELGPIDGMGVEQVGPDAVDPENSGKEIEALSSQAGELASFMKTLIGDIKSLEDRVNSLMPPPADE